MDSVDLINTVLLAAIAVLLGLVVAYLRRSIRLLAPIAEVRCGLDELRGQLEPVLAGALPVFADLRRALAPPSADDLPGADTGSAKVQATFKLSPDRREPGTTAWPGVSKDCRFDGPLPTIPKQTGSILVWLYNQHCSEKLLLRLHECAIEKGIDLGSDLPQPVPVAHVIPK